METEMMEIFSSALLPVIILDLIMCIFIIGGAIIFVTANINYEPEADKKEPEE